MKNGAKISEDGLYRYELTRYWGDYGDTETCLTWIMLNPSTADANQDDPTIRRVISFSIREGYGGCRVLNLFGLRSTNPKELYLVGDRIGKYNDHEIAKHNGENTVVAWGAHKLAEHRAQTVLDFLLPKSQIFCLGKTKHGAPRHPLYVPSTQKLIEYRSPIHG